MSLLEDPITFVVPGDLRLTEPGLKNHRAALRAPDEPGPFVLATHPHEALLATGPRHVVAGRDRFEVRVWSRSPVASVRGRVDGGDWFAMESGPTGRWSAPLDGARLAKGRHRFEALALDASGAEGSRAIDFLVDPTGRHTAVPAAVPAVESTAFC